MNREFHRYALAQSQIKSCVQTFRGIEKNGNQLTFEGRVGEKGVAKIDMIPSVLEGGRFKRRNMVFQRKFRP